MFGFQGFDRILDTPHKKVKPNEESTLDPCSSKADKVPILSKLKAGVLSQKKEANSQVVDISPFELPMEYRRLDSLSEKMEQEQEEGELALKMPLQRKFTCGLEPQQEQYPMNSLNLYRNSSTCDQTRQIQDVKLGDNIYLKPLSYASNSLVRRVSKHPDCRLRLEQDYEIQQNLKRNNRHHSGYICLNKLERIFYYVKKITMSWQQHQSYQFLQKIASQQIKIYNSDPEGHFLRFYQSWFEHNALYLTFEVAVESLDDATLARSRLRQIQVWDLLRDCCSSLKWLKDSHQLAHLNIKPGNIIKCQKKFKLVDPYCTKEALQMYLQKEGDSWNGWTYLAPEIRNYAYLLEGLDFASADIYSLGMCVIENLLGDRYFPREGRALRVHLQKHLHGYSPSLVRTLLGMVSLDPRKRPRACQICRMQQRQGQKRTKTRRFSI